MGNGCRQKCEEVVGCTAIVTGGNECFLRSNVDRSKCKHSSQRTTTLLKNKAETGCVGGGDGYQPCYPQHEGGAPCCDDQSGTPMVCVCNRLTSLMASASASLVRLA